MGKTLRRVDNGKGDVKKHIDKLFDSLDKNKNGVLDGKEYTLFLQNACDYMMKDFKKLGHEYSRESVYKWLQDSLDRNKDGKITKQELHDNLKKVLDYGEK